MFVLAFVNAVTQMHFGLDLLGSIQGFPVLLDRISLDVRKYSGQAMLKIPIRMDFIISLVIVTVYTDELIM